MLEISDGVRCSMFLVSKARDELNVMQEAHNQIDPTPACGIIAFKEAAHL